MRGFRGRMRSGVGAGVLAVSALLGGAAYGSGPGPALGSAQHVQHGTVVRDDLKEVFRKAGVRGTFALLDVRRGRTTVVDKSRANTRLIPASTFKIPHSLIALETGVIRDEFEVIPYGGQPQQFPEWEQDMNLRDAVRASNVPVFQTLARRIGLHRERVWADRLQYGDREIGPVVDRFWLDGPLEISAVEQTRFLARLARQELPVARRHQLTVRDILKSEEKEGYALFAKTGWGMSTEPNIGWWVGWVERGGELFTFALNIDVVADGDTAKRVPVARELLAALGVLPAA
ncbi:class D beta-lactamase [Actinocorallia sp. A-T 12471]|uniref:class D beta-lactamase n=1 Tax=Actinocorallia sp. A-T 12471 TaxID=3089813 RepID=UPI0029CF17C5|nr:class D beta-lactamase [Actinocorallia sp. A-T 12471]MDX6742354.1 class D beta-lactamase [Actinocorallia sp. A-T 12471]